MNPDTRTIPHHSLSGTSLFLEGKDLPILLPPDLRLQAQLFGVWFVWFVFFCLAFPFQHYVLLPAYISNSFCFEYPFFFHEDPILEFCPCSTVGVASGVGTFLPPAQQKSTSTANFTLFSYFRTLVYCLLLVCSFSERSLSPRWITVDRILSRVFSPNFFFLFPPSLS